MSSLKELRAERIEKLTRLKSLGIESFPAVSRRDTIIGQITNAFDSFSAKNVTVAGRIFALREHGVLVFIDIGDESGLRQREFLKLRR